MSSGGSIGSKAFVQEVACRFEDEKRVMKKELSTGKLGISQLYCFKYLRM